MKLNTYTIDCVKSELVAVKEYTEKNNYDVVQVKRGEHGALTPNGEYGVCHEPTSSDCFYLTLEEMVNIMNKIRDIGDDGTVTLKVTVGPIGNSVGVVVSGTLIDVTDYSVW